MNKQFIYTILFFTYLLLSCNHTSSFTEDDIPILTIDIHKKQPVQLSSLLEDISYTLLDNSLDEYLIGEVDFMKVAGDKLYTSTLNRLLVYDINTGQVIYQLNNYGEAPGQYLSITDLIVEPEAGGFELLDKKIK
ncbi:MAG: 6-bladed beta-propeller [Tannerellaceae bacterium]|nr:6-bladed beta-propeller [Tannerellaceae bacterium]